MGREIALGYCYYLDNYSCSLRFEICIPIPCTPCDVDIVDMFGKIREQFCNATQAAFYVEILFPIMR